MTVDCPRCFKARWHATGRFNVNRHDRRRAELICDACGYAFASALPEALTTGETVAVTLPSPPPPRVPVATKQPYLSPTAAPTMTPVAQLARDFRKLAAGDDE